MTAPTVPADRPVPLVEVHPDAGTLATRIAGELLSRIADLQAAGEVPQIALTGGTIADAVHHEVARLAPDAGVDWGAVDLWWGDERYVAPDSGDRNAGQARAAFIDALGVPGHRVHEMPSSSAACSVDEAARAYAAELGDRAFDVLMLGVGPDGHVASLFPGRPEADSAALALAVAGSPKPPPDRVSLTLRALCLADEVWLLATGQAKAPAVAAALGGDRSLPAARVHGRSATRWFLDADAAADLPPGLRPSR